jgi:cytochrome c peroxidase
VKLSGDAETRRIAFLFFAFLLCAAAVFLLTFYLAGDARGQARPLTSDEERGRELFNDPRLSSNGKVSCATCHREDKGYSAGGLPPALDGGKLSTKAPSLWNVGAHRTLFWDGRATSLEEQAAGPLTNPREMGNRSVAEAAKRVGLSSKELVRLLAAYERTLVPAPSRLDEYLTGRQDQIMGAQEIRGWNLFRGKAECYKCHDPKNGFKDDKFHNTGLAGEGRFAVSNKRKDFGAFKTPGLRRIKFHAPYMHDCSLKTLEDVVRFYNEGGIKNRNLDKDIRPLRLNRQEEADLVAFLKVL